MHKHIYTLDEINLDETNKIKRLRFKLLRNISPAETVYIVDECSMLSDQSTGSVFIQFGSGKLLTDFFSFTGKRKIIFSGDPSQLPPVNFPYSPALKAAHLEKTHLKKVKSAGLTLSMRFPESSGIYSVTDNLRKKVETDYRGYFNIYVSSFADIDVISDQEKMVEHYVTRIKTSGIDNAIFLTFSNALSNRINLYARQLLFKKSGILIKGESLVVMQNNYLHDVANGEHLEVVEVTDEKQYLAGLTFRRIKATVQDIHGKRIFTPFIIEDLLSSPNPSLSNEQETNLFIDFVVRAREKGITEKNPEFIMLLKIDPYLNALRVKYGYAITCHKAQGGEWPHVYLVFEGSLFYQEKSYLHRWAYTALSRSSQNLYLLNNNCIF